MQKASERHDRATKELITKLHRVPREVRASVLMAYINKCRQRHNIAFLQWRYRFPHEKTFNNLNKSEQEERKRSLEVLIQTRIDKLIEEDAAQDQ